MKFELEDFHRDISDKELLNDMKRVAAKLNQNFVTVRQQNEHGKYHPTTIINRFSGWLKAIERAGLGRSKQQTDKWISEEALFENLEEVWTEVGSPTKTSGYEIGGFKIWTRSIR
jgi:hypothetical protein